MAYSTGMTFQPKLNATYYKEQAYFKQA